MDRTKGSRRALAAAAALWLGVAGTEGLAWAADGAAGGGDPGAARIEPVVVTATRIEQGVEQVGSSVTVITGDELRRRGIEFVTDALQEVPGATVRAQGTRGKSASVFIRGANPEQVLVLVDGVRVNDVGGGFDLSLLATDNVERIEVIRGPQSPLYGADAIGGVINVITRRGRGPLEASVGVAAGNYHTSGVDAAVRGADERVAASVEVSRFASGNRFENDDFENRTASGRLDLRLGSRLGATVSFRHTQADTGVPGQILAAPSLVDRQTTVLDTATASLEHRTTSAWTQRLAASRADQELEFISSAGRSLTDSTLQAVEWVHTVTPAAPLSVLVGGEYRVEDGEGFTVDETLTTRALFAQAQLFLLGERLSLLGGARVDDGTQLDSEVTPKAALAFLLEETGARLHASWGRGIRAPTLLDLFFPGFGNPDLDPERAVGWDAGVEQRFWGDRMTADVTFFRQDYSDLIVFSSATGLPENVGQAHSYGVESTATARPARWLDVGAAYTYLVARNDVTGDRLLRRPRHQGSAQVTARPLERATATLAGLYVGSRRDNLFPFPPIPDFDLGGYFRVDLSARYRLGRVAGARAVELFGRVENLLGRDYQEVAGFPALGVNFLAGVRGTF
jgi:vitamin B12 transporter